MLPKWCPADSHSGNGPSCSNPRKGIWLIHERPRSPQFDSLLFEWSCGQNLEFSFHAAKFFSYSLIY